MSFNQSCQGGDEDKFKECGAAVETLTDERTCALEDVVWGKKVPGSVRAHSRTVLCCENHILPSYIKPSFGITGDFARVGLNI